MLPYILGLLVLLDFSIHIIYFMLYAQVLLLQFILLNFWKNLGIKFEDGHDFNSKIIYNF